MVLVCGDLVLAEPAATRVAAALAEASGCAAEEHRRPTDLASLFQDVRTFSLFAPAKVLLLVDTAVLADRGAAADLVDDAAEALPLPDTAGRELSPRERQAASRLLQALGLFDVDPYAGEAEKAIAGLPAWAFEGGSGGAGKGGRGGSRRGKKTEELRAGLAALLEAARREGLQGFGGGALAELGRIAREGLPPGHALVLAERAVAAGHPLRELLAERGAVLSVGELAAGRGDSWEGLDLLAEELERQTGIAIARDALTELARRTLRKESDGRRGEAAGADGESSARFAGEYRKLAEMALGAGARRIERGLVEQAVGDRGEGDVWQLLDAVADGKAGEALDRLGRLLAAADDPLAARLSFFSLFASFCKQLAAVRGLMRLHRVPAGESSYPRFKSRWAEVLQGDLGLGLEATEDDERPGRKSAASASKAGGNPISGLHPFRLHRAYLAASRLPEPFLARLPAEVLETELRLKGESGEADTALAHLVGRVAAAAGGQTRRPARDSR